MLVCVLADVVLHPFFDRFYSFYSLFLPVFQCFLLFALVATLFGTIFLRDPPRSRGDLSSRARVNQQALDRKKANFVYHFLVNDQSDFILGR